MKDEERIDRSLEGLLSDAEAGQLSRDILADPDLKRSYVERSWLHAQLAVESESLLTERTKIVLRSHRESGPRSNTQPRLSVLLRSFFPFLSIRRSRTWRP